MLEKAAPRVLVLIQADPLKSHRAVEALRIALGLGSNNEGQNLNIILSDRAPYLLAEDTSGIVDGEILEKHLPVFVEWGTIFIITPTAEAPARWHPDVLIKRAGPGEIEDAFQVADRVLVF